MSIGDIAGFSRTVRQGDDPQPINPRVYVTVPEPSSTGDSVYVVPIGSDENWPVEVASGHWEPRGALPSQGDEGIVVFDSSNDAWLLWQSASGDVTVVQDADYTVLGTDQVVMYGSLSRTRTVTLGPGSGAGRELRILDDSGLADEFPIVVFGPVNGGIVAALKDPYGEMVLRWDGSTWTTASWPVAARPPVIAGVTYKVSPTDPAASWQTVAQVNAALAAGTIHPGDGVLFQGGVTFGDAQLTTAAVGGAMNQPITFGSYGSGMAILPQAMYAYGSWYVIDHLDMSGGTLTLGSISHSSPTNHVVVQRCHVNLSSQHLGTYTVGFLLWGDDWVISDCYIHDCDNDCIHFNRNVPSGGSYPQVQYCDQAVVSQCVLAAWGLVNPGYHCHGIYANCSNIVGTRNVLCGTDGPGAATGFSPRCHGSMFAGNHFGHTGEGIGYFPYDPVGTLSIWERNTVVGASDAGLYVDPSTGAGTSDGGQPYTYESFIVRWNTLKRCLIPINGYGRSKGSYQQYGNTVIEVPSAPVVEYRPELSGAYADGPMQNPRIPTAGLVYADANYQMLTSDSGAVARQAAVVTLPAAAQAGDRFVVKHLAVLNNLFPNPSFEVDIADMTCHSGTSAALSQTAVQAQNGTKSLQIASNGPSDYVSVFRGSGGVEVPYRDGQVTPGLQYTASAYMRAATTARGWAIVISWWDATDGFISESQGRATLDNSSGWTRISVTGTAPAATVYFNITIQTFDAPPAGETHYCDTVMMSVGAVVLPYGDGNSSGWAWAGTAGKSASTGPTPAVSVAVPAGLIDPGSLNATSQTIAFGTLREFERAPDGINWVAL
jgi:hypothetical protein